MVTGCTSQYKILKGFIGIWDAILKLIGGICCACAGRIELGCLGVMWLLAVGVDLSVPQVHAPAAEFWTRLNYGTMAIREKKLYVAEGYMSHIFHLSLPREVEYVDNSTLQSCDALCQRMKAIPVAIQRLRTAMKRTIIHMITEIYDLVPDLEDKRSGQRRRIQRGFLDFVGDASSYLFGTATESEIEALKKEIEAIKALAGMAAADATRTREGMMTYTKITGERLDTMHEILRGQQTDIEGIIRTIKTISDSTYYEFNAMAILTNEIADFVQIHDSVQTLREGVAELVHGMITPKLISPRQLAAAVNEMAALLRKRSGGGALCYKSAQEIYASQSYNYVRHGHDIFVKIRIPYSSFSRLTAYRTVTVPMPVPGRQGLVTELKDFPRYLIASTALTRVGELDRIPASGVVDVGEIKWHRGVENACVYQVFNDVTDKVREFCDFTTSKKVIEPEIIRLADGVYVVTNSSQIKITCNGTEYQTLTNCTPCKIGLDCNCTLDMGYGTNIIRRMADRECTIGQVSTSALHAVNLAVLQTFYDMGSVEIKGDELFQPTQHKIPADISWPFFSKNTTRLLARDREESYSLKKLASSLENSSVVLHSPSEALLYDYIQQQTEVNSFWSFKNYGWVSYAVCTQYVVIGTVILFVYINHRRTRLAMAPLAMASPLLLPKTTAISTFDLRTVAPELISTTTVPAIIQWLNNIEYHDKIMMVFIIVLSIVSAISIYAMRYLASRRSYVFFNISNGRNVYLLKYRSLPNASRCFTIFTGGRTKLAIRNYIFFGIVSFESKPWKVINALTGRKYRCKSHVFVRASQVSKIRMLLDDNECAIKPLVVHSHEYVYIPTSKGEGKQEDPPNYNEDEICM